MAQKPTTTQLHWVNVPHEGPREFEFEFTWASFSDGVPRAICTSETIPSEYWPTAVFVLNLASGAYEPVGAYRPGDAGDRVFIPPP